MAKFIDLTGKIFGRLTVLQRAEKKGKGAYWECICECGRKRVVAGYHLRTGHTMSCGCLRKNVVTTHGQWNSRVYRSWNKMLQRCTNPNDDRFADYGGRGITVCDRWRVFENFHQDMGDRPQGMSLDRIDVDGDYCLSNCRWATPMQQSNNTRTNHILTYNGESHSIAEWSRRTSIHPATISRRIGMGWDACDVLTKPLQKKCNHIRYGYGG